ncbi:MAG: DUF4857 domain-containing protein [Paramuribaculum sp.]|nr:DUF4857 domain-containing protein [Paramuribaculum sp.]
MKKLYYIVFALLSTAVLSWVLPWLYSLCFTERDREPFVGYSPISDCLVVSDFSSVADKEDPVIFEVDPVSKEAVNRYTMDQRDSLLPEIFVGQLSAKGTMPDSIKGVEVTMRDIRLNSWIFSSSPKDLNRSVPTVYPLMESMPARFKFEDPEVVLTLDNGLKIYDIESNAIDPVRTGRFAKMFADKGFAFPAKEANGNVTTRKSYDNGYLIIDNNDNLYHLKMQANRPSMARIAIDDTIVPRHVFVLENADRKLYGLFTDQADNMYAINHDDTYSIVKLSGIKFNPETDKITIMKNLFSWCVKVRSGNVTKWVALDPDTYGILADYSFISSTSLSTVVKGWIFPFTTCFTSADDKYVYPRIEDWSWHALFLNLILAVIVFFAAKGKNMGCTAGKSMLTLICGLYAFITLMLMKRVSH